MRPIDRRSFLVSGAATALAGPALAQSLPDTVVEEGELSATRHNTASFRAQDWRPHFNNLANGAILVDISSRALHHWTEDGRYSLFPSSVPMSEEMTRRGRTRVVKKVEGPTWRPTPNMRRRNPEWPAVVPPGPENPLGTHALYLSWTYYRIHGTHDKRKIGRRSSSGCIGLYNEHIARLFANSRVGTQVLLI
ncbi:putative L,D-transpeptidase ErfK/SrfK precursor [Jannaschia seosinensis]|uniref:Putative L,D-transpeptidase ErfK/SrfK n=1 Tax=Jannaschia seosinensis TaxID=313367 RepID=A0A0M7BC61_9RHOB|nr:L,D-transpeptidase [Jannaschia seosinensis]CUH38925.1 putative L,D-transpeptidase ErfK/SrfK precursor [Jannaschia seosinensis]